MLKEETWAEVEEKPIVGWKLQQKRCLGWESGFGVKAWGVLLFHSFQHLLIMLLLVRRYSLVSSSQTAV